MRVCIAQIAPVFLDKRRTLEKVVAAIDEAGKHGASLVAFGETLVPAYPHWLSRTDAARFNASDQKELHALYLDQSVVISEDTGNSGDLDDVRRVAGKHNITVVLGVAERAMDRAGHTVYCSRVVIGLEPSLKPGVKPGVMPGMKPGMEEAPARVLSVHRKLMPTYEERLSWGIGDGAGLVAHPVGQLTLGALNCWENWMPLVRAALYAQGVNLHVALWPGCVRNTIDITRFIAMESRSFVLSASSLLREQDIPAGVPFRERMVTPGELISDGGSCIAGPDGQWIVPPVSNEERLIYADVSLDAVRRERQNFDPSGHYARPDVFELRVDRRRQAVATYLNG